MQSHYQAIQTNVDDLQKMFDLLYEPPTKTGKTKLQTLMNFNKAQIHALVVASVLQDIADECDEDSVSPMSITELAQELTDRGFHGISEATLREVLKNMYQCGWRPLVREKDNMPVNSGPQQYVWYFDDETYSELIRS